MTMAADDRAGPAPLDGNGVAGLLREVFACEMTVAIITCSGCGTSGPAGAIRVFGGAMGAIFRCAACDTAVLRVARTPRGVWLDLRGACSVVVPNGR
jgi:Family of unknown function (DUF6510)